MLIGSQNIKTHSEGTVSHKIQQKKAKGHFNPFDTYRSRWHLDLQVIAERLDLQMPSRLKYLVLYKSELVVIYPLKLQAFL